MSKLIVRIPALAVVLLVWSCSHTTVYQADFSGVVTANNPVVGSPSIGSTISGTYSLDTAEMSGEGPNCSGIPNCWSGPAHSWSWNGDDATTSLSAVTITVDDVPPGSGADSYTVVLRGFDTFVTATLQLTDSSGSAFESAVHELTPRFSAFDSATFNFVPLCLTGISCVENHYYSGDLDSLQFRSCSPPLY